MSIRPSFSTVEDALKSIVAQHGETAPVLGTGSRLHELPARESFPVEAAAARTVTLINDLIEQVKSGARGAVSFELSNGDQPPLSVTLEYKEGLLRTTFRTDSAELRAALGREWGTAVAGLVSDSQVRVIEPSFAPASNRQGETPLNTSSQHQQQHRQASADARNDFGSAQVSPWASTQGRGTQTSSSSVQATRRSLPTGNSHHLNVLA